MTRIILSSEEVYEAVKDWVEKNRPGQVGGKCRLWLEEIGRNNDFVVVVEEKK